MRFSKDNETKKLIYLVIFIIALTAIIFTMIYLWYNDELTKQAELNVLDMSYLNSVNETKAASSTQDKSINTVKNETIKNTVKNSVTNEKVAVKTENTKLPSENTVVENKEIPLTEEQFEGNEIELSEEELLEFEAPISGDIIKDFAEESLVYSKTLDEWTTHMGIDIRAEKTSVVKASEKGTIENIKNDPRYGLTIVIEHDNGFQTVYSNLLTSEFVVEGEKVEKGQSIGTVGNTAVFEIADEPHLHFEILKDSIQVDAGIYVK